MSDLTQTPANVGLGTNAIALSPNDVAGEAISAGMPVYEDSADSGKCKKSKADTAAHAKCKGLALNSAGTGQPLVLQKTGLFKPGGTVVIGQIYVVSKANAGGIAPYSDLASGDFVTIIGVGYDAANIKLSINESGIAKA